MQLDEYQKKASEIVDGNYFVSSPAGSGKTRTSLERIKNLIEHGVDHKKILFITFSKRATEEMRDKLNDMIYDNDVYISTIHSMCFQLYRWLTRKRLQVLSDYKQKKLMREIFKSKHMPMDSMGAIIHHINTMKSMDIYYDEIRKIDDNFSFSNEYKNLLIHAFELYENKKDSMTPEGIDFTDMMFKLYRLLNNNPSYVNKIQNIWDYILIDEFQDTSELQFNIIKILSGKCNSIYVIGDANQSIYAWRGANPDFMSNFDKYVDPSYKIRLQYTYRCAEKINGVANLLINPEDHAKSATGVSGNVTYIKRIPNEFYEADLVGELIKTKHNDELVKILYRTNAQSMALEVDLARKRIPYKLLGQQQFFDRKEVKDIMSYIDVIYNQPKDLTDSWQRIINRPNRYLGNAFKEQLTKLSSTDTVINSLESFRFSKKYMNDNAYRLSLLIKGFTGDKTNPKDIIEYILEQTQYLDWVNSHYNSNNSEDNSNSQEVIQELKLLAVSMGSTEHLLNMLSVRTDPNANVELMSIHKSKGLEADTVFVLDVNNKIMPHFMNDDLNEEQNLLYVAITRARNNLYILNTREYNGKPHSESTFIQNIISEPYFQNTVTIVDYHEFKLNLGGSYEGI